MKVSVRGHVRDPVLEVGQQPQLSVWCLLELEICFFLSLCLCFDDQHTGSDIHSHKIVEMWLLQNGVILRGRYDANVMMLSRGQTQSNSNIMLDV